MTATHTPTPWRAARWTSHAPRTVLVDDPAAFLGCRIVAECERDEDAAFIVAACKAQDALVDTLRKIANWELPETGKTWDDGTPMSYGGAFGSNGERDYFRQLAADALAGAAP